MAAKPAGKKFWAPEVNLAQFQMERMRLYGNEVALVSMNIYFELSEINRERLMMHLYQFLIYTVKVTLSECNTILH